MKQHAFRKLNEIEYIKRHLRSGKDNKLSIYSKIPPHQLLDTIKSNDEVYQSFINELADFNNGRDENLETFTSSGLNALIESGYYGSEKHIASVHVAGQANVESGWASELGNTYGKTVGVKNLIPDDGTKLKKWREENPEAAHAQSVSNGLKAGKISKESGHMAKIGKEWGPKNMRKFAKENPEQASANSAKASAVARKNRDCRKEIERSIILKKFKDLGEFQTKNYIHFVETAFNKPRNHRYLGYRLAEIDGFISYKKIIESPAGPRNQTVWVYKKN